MKPKETDVSDSMNILRRGQDNIMFMLVRNLKLAVTFDEDVRFEDFSYIKQLIQSRLMNCHGTTPNNDEKKCTLVVNNAVPFTLSLIVKYLIQRRLTV